MDSSLGRPAAEGGRSADAPDGISDAASSGGGSRDRASHQHTSAALRHHQNVRRGAAVAAADPKGRWQLPAAAGNSDRSSSDLTVAVGSGNGLIHFP